MNIEEALVIIEEMTPCANCTYRNTGCNRQNEHAWSDGFCHQVDEALGIIRQTLDLSDEPYNPEPYEPEPEPNENEGGESGEGGENEGEGTGEEPNNESEGGEGSGEEPEPEPEEPELEEELEPEEP